MSIDCSVVSVMRVVIKRLSLESRDFRDDVVLYLNYLHVKFYNEIKRKYFRI